MDKQATVDSHSPDTYMPTGQNLHINDQWAKMPLVQEKWCAKY